jgi:hypothetical protein
LLLCPAGMRRDFRSRCLPMIDRRGWNAARVLRSLHDDGETCTSAAKAARFWLDYVVAEATTFKDFRTLTPTPRFQLLRLIFPTAQLQSTEHYSLWGFELTR